MISAISSRRNRSGMILFEIITALAIFGMCALGLMRAITLATQTAIESQLQLRLIERLQSSLTEVCKEPNIAQYDGQDFRLDPDALGISTTTTVRIIEKMENSEQQPVQDMYEVVTTAFYDNFGQKGELSVTTWRYGRLYRTQGAAGGAQPAAPTQ